MRSLIFYSELKWKVMSPDKLRNENTERVRIGWGKRGRRTRWAISVFTVRRR